METSSLMVCDDVLESNDILPLDTHSINATQNIHGMPGGAIYESMYMVYKAPIVPINP